MKQHLSTVNIIFVMLGLLSTLAGCSSANGVSDARTATAGAMLQEAATVTAQGVDLPGRLLFVRSGDIWLWNGASGKQLTQQGDLAQPAWSPDGTQIVCVRRGPSYSDIVLLSLQNGDALTLTDGDSSAPPNSFERARSTIWSFYPRFAPDGQTILYASQAGPAVGEPASDYNLSLYRTGATVGSERTQIYASDTGHVGRIAVGPNGMTLFALQPTAGEPEIMRYAENEATPLQGIPAGSYDPAVSADGQWITFAARSNGATDVYAIPTSGGTPAKLTTTGAARAGVLSPDNRWLAFLDVTPGSSSFDLWIAPITLSDAGMQAGEPRALTNGMHLDPDSGLTWGQ